MNKEVKNIVNNNDGSRTVYYEDGSFSKMRNGKVVSSGGPVIGKGTSLKKKYVRKMKKGGRVLKMNRGGRAKK